MLLKLDNTYINLNSLIAIEVHNNIIEFIFPTKSIKLELNEYLEKMKLRILDTYKLTRLMMRLKLIDLLENKKEFKNIDKGELTK